MRRLTTGLHPDVPHGVYHQRDLGMISKSALDLVNRSPQHYLAWIEGAEEEETPALAFGSAFHCALLEPERYLATYSQEPDFGDCRRTENKRLRDAWRAANVGKKEISDADARRIDAMCLAIREHPLAGKMIRDGVAEVTARWEDPDTGLPAKCRADYFVESLGMVADVKTTMDARPETFRKDVAKYGYHRQDALYRTGFRAVGAAVRHFVFIAVEKDPPHAIGIYALDGAAIAKGTASVRSDIATLAECVKTGTFPGYSTSIETIQLPPWAA
jgi:hypothetical protein